MHDPHLSDDEGHRPAKRRRFVTSCSECRRRKQKCDRKTPCNNCVARHVAGKCFYQDSLTSNEQVDIPSDRAEQDGLDPNSSPEESIHNFGDLGYSLIARSNTFVGLKDVLQSESEFQEITAAHNSALRTPKLGVRKLVAHLPERSAIEELVAVYFAHINWHYFFLERFYFDDLFNLWFSSAQGSVKYLDSKGLSQELEYFPALLFQIVALALQFLPPDAPVISRLSPDGHVTAERYSDIGNQIVTLLGRHGAALTAVQADLLRCFCLKNFGRGIDSWHCLGNSIRQAQELDLHRQKEIRQKGAHGVDATLSLMWYDEYRRRVWINLFAWDSLMAMILGRPRVINMDDCDIIPPLDCNIPDDPSTTVPTAIQPDTDMDHPTTVSASLFRYALAHKIHEMRKLKVDKPHPKDYSVIQGLHDQVLSLLDNVPPYLRHRNPDTSWDSKYPYLPQQREEILTIVNLFLMTLHRPHIVTHTLSRKAALQAAISTLEAQQRFFIQTSKHHYKLFMLSYFTIDASILLSVMMVLYPPSDEDQKRYIDEILRHATDRLTLIAPYNPMAKSGLAILQSCYQRLKEVSNSPKHTDTSSSNHPSTSGNGSGYSDDLLNNPEQLGSFVNSQPSSLSSLASLGFDLPTTEMDTAASDFDVSYWLDNLDKIHDVPPVSLNTDFSWDSAIFNEVF